MEQIRSLQTLPRKGWVRRGIRNPETVWEHTTDCVSIGRNLAVELGVGRRRLIKMLTGHDWPESDPNVGDITPHCGIPPTEKFEREHAAMQKLCAQLQKGSEFLELWLEFEEGLTPEAQVAKQIDKLQMAMKAVYYQDEQGLDPREFLADAGGRISHPRLRHIFEHIERAASIKTFLDSET